jgi:C4-dicarboxylate-specific signal transduction histidine kinase
MLAAMIVAAVLVLAVLCCGVVWNRGRSERRRLSRALDEAIAGREALQRVTRLAGRDLRDAALRLTGQAAALAASGPAEPDAALEASAKLAVVAERCRMLADDLGGAGLPLTAATLREDRIGLLAYARDAVAAVSAALAPGRRHFLLPAAATARGDCVWADSRAVRQVLGRVLAEAAFNTRENESIALLLEEEAGDLVLAVADEGSGMTASDTEVSIDDTPPWNSRGLGAGMALSRALMEAHGGRLDVLTDPSAGTRVSLVFPRERRRA